MTFQDRSNLYKEIEQKRGRPLICYVTSSRINASGAMSTDVIPELAKQINAISFAEKAIDILIISNGGDPTVSWRFISMIRERFKEIGALLPYAAYSAATLLALGANEILMHPFSNLGPVDPQLHYIRRQGQQEDTVAFGSEDLKHYFDFIKRDVGISDQEQLQRAFELICKDVGAIPIGVANRSSHLALSMGEKLLRLHMKDENKVKAIAEALNTSFYHHGYPLGRNEAKSIGLPVKEPQDDIGKLMWDIWLNFEAEMECNNPFNPVDVVFQNPNNASLLGTVPQILMPANLPPEIKQQAYQQILNNISIQPSPAVDYSLFQAGLESVRCKSEFRTNGKINAVRNPDMSIAVSVIPLQQGWFFTAI